MVAEHPETGGPPEEPASGDSIVSRRLEEFAKRLDTLEANLRRLEYTTRASVTAPQSAREGNDEFDYRVLLHARTYTIEDIVGRAARMESVRHCLANREMPCIRTRYHTGSGDREAAYSYRLIEEGAAEVPWTLLEYRINSERGADYSAHLPLTEPIPEGATFELHHELHLRDSFTSRNEWVTLVVEYPTDEFHLEVLIPSGRKIVGVRREESQGASNSFNKRRVYPRILNETGQTCLEWRETAPVTGRAYTLFWDW